MADNPPDLSALSTQLEALFQAYPAGNHCDICAREVGSELRKVGFDVAIVTIQNESNPGQPTMRPPYIQAKMPDGKPFLLGQNGFHQANRITFQNAFYYTDPLVYLHQGVTAVSEEDYFGLFVYPDGMEITDVKAVPGG
jgi:hypothetical protein